MGAEDEQKSIIFSDNPNILTKTLNSGVLFNAINLYLIL